MGAIPEDRGDRDAAVESPLRIAIAGGGEEAIRLLPLLTRDPFAEIVLWIHPDPQALRKRVQAVSEILWMRIESRVSTEKERLTRARDLDLVIDASESIQWRSRLAQLRFRNVKVLNARSARLLWEFRSAADRTGQKHPQPEVPARQLEVLASLGEIIETMHLVTESDELLSLILLVAMESTAAEEGSVLLLDPEDSLLKVHVAQGIEAELIPKIRIPLGEGIAGLVAKENRPLLVAGKADERQFRILKKREGIVSAVSAPLAVNGSTIGVLNVSTRRSEHEFTEADLDFVTKLASLATEIIRRSQQYAALRAEARLYRLAAELKDILAAPGAAADRLRPALLRITELLPSCVGTIYTFDPRDDELRMTATTAQAILPPRSFTIDSERGVEGWVLRERLPVVLREDVRETEGEREQKVFCAFPILHGDTSLGVLSLQSVSPKGLPKEDETLLTELALLLGEAIAQAQREESITQRATRLAAINEAGFTFIATEDLDRLGKLIASTAILVLAADSCIFRLLDDRVGEYTIRSYFGSADEELQRRLFELDRQVAIRVIRDDAPLVAKNARQLEGLLTASVGARSLLSYPIHAGGNVIGAVSIYDKIIPDSFYPVAFQREDQEIFERLVGYAELAVEKALEHDSHSAARDEETGLPNEAYFTKRVEEEIGRARRVKRKLFILTCQINREAGEPTKDLTRQTRVIESRIGEALRNNLRGFDVVARIRPGCFAILFPDIGNQTIQAIHTINETISRLTRVINDALHEGQDAPWPVAAPSLRLAYGYAIYPEEAESASGLLEQADRIRVKTY